jgi:hypothetical protein
VSENLADVAARNGFQSAVIDRLQHVLLHYLIPSRRQSGQARTPSAWLLPGHIAIQRISKS